MRIGVSILTREGQSLWENGIGQNVFHLATALKNIPFVRDVFLLDCGEHFALPQDAGQFAHQFPLIPLAQAPDDLDIVIEVAGGINPEWLARARAAGTRSILYVCGQPYAALVEATTFAKPYFFGNPDRLDEVWLLPKDRAFAPMMRSLYRCPVREMPYLWSPSLLEQTIALLGESDPGFGYAKGGLERPRAAIFEPNISTLKMGIIPLMLCEQALRSDPSAIDHVTLLNGKHIEEHPTFQFLRQRLKIQEAGRLTIESRQYFAAHMANNANIVVSHQIDCDQNYLYFDALYGGYPLIHNSAYFSDVGYYYPDSDIEAGTSCLLHAIAHHDEELDHYRMKASKFIAAHHPETQANCSRHARGLLALTGNIRGLSL